MKYRFIEGQNLLFSREPQRTVLTRESGALDFVLYVRRLQFTQSWTQVMVVSCCTWPEQKQQPVVLHNHSLSSQVTSLFSINSRWECKIGLFTECLASSDSKTIMICLCTINKDITVLFCNHFKLSGAMLACYTPSGTTEMTGLNIKECLKLPFLCYMCGLVCFNACCSTAVDPLLWHELLCDLRPLGERTSSITEPPSLKPALPYINNGKKNKCSFLFSVIFPLWSEYIL